jgi:hypothetical protein
MEWHLDSVLFTSLVWPAKPALPLLLAAHKSSGYSGAI